MIKKAWLILILIPLATAGAFLLIFAFQHEIRIPPEAGETAEFRLKGDFPRKWAVKETRGPIRSMETDGGAIYYTSRSAAAIDAATGDRKWETGPEAKTPLALGGGLAAYGSTDGNLYAFDTASGAEKWRFKSGESNAAPEISGGKVYYGEAGGLVHAIDAATGQEKWHINAPGSVTLIAADENTVGVLAKGAQGPSSATISTIIIADASTGAVKWKDAKEAEFTSLEINGGFAYLLIRYSGIQPQSAYLSAIDTDSQTVKWEKPAQSFAPVMKILDGTLFAGSVENDEAFLRGFDLKSGEERFSVGLGRKQAAPKVSALADGFVFFAGNAEIDAASAATGELRWRAQTEGPLTITPLVAGDSLCFTYGSTGAIYALQLPSR